MFIIEVQCLGLIIYEQFVMQISSSGIFSFFFFKVTCSFTLKIKKKGNETHK